MKSKQTKDGEGVLKFDGFFKRFTPKSKDINTRLEIMEKARAGRYFDTSKNRRLKRVGQQYGSKKEEEQGKKKEIDKYTDGDLTNFARASTDENLQRLAVGSNERLRIIAKKELERRKSGVLEEGKIPEKGNVEKEKEKSEKKSENTYFVVRDTDYPQEDLDRNWSAFASGSCNGELGGSTEEEARENYASQIGIEANEVDCEFRFHPAYNEFVAVHYEGLGAFVLDSENLEDALNEADNYEEGLAVTMGQGDGHFSAEDVVSFHKVREGRYIFEIKY